MNDAVSNSYLTIQQTPSTTDMVKFGELCEVKESLPLKLADRRAINTLILSAWDGIADPDKSIVLANENYEDLKTQGVVLLASTECSLAYRPAS